MIREALEYLVTPCCKTHRKMGYLSEAIAIGARYKRVKAAWEPHLKASKNAILNMINALPEKQLVVVLGSGSLLDVPLERLCNAFEKVKLVDVAHPLSVRKEIRQYPNCELIEIDITGIAASVLNNAKALPKCSDESLLKICKGADWTISLNMLSQLPLSPCSKLQKHHDEENLSVWSKELQAIHIQGLKTLKNATLLADIQRSTIYKDSETLRHNFEYVEGLGAPNRQWDWQVIPEGESHTVQSVINTVGFWEKL